MGKSDHLITLGSTVHSCSVVSIVVIHTDDVVRRRGYCDHDVTICVSAGVYVSKIKRKLSIRMA